jgi:hypothetical protein
MCSKLCNDGGVVSDLPRPHVLYMAGQGCRDESLEVV